MGRCLRGFAIQSKCLVPDTDSLVKILVMGHAQCAHRPPELVFSPCDGSTVILEGVRQLGKERLDRLARDIHSLPPSDLVGRNNCAMRTRPVKPLEIE